MSKELVWSGRTGDSAEWTDAVGGGGSERVTLRIAAADLAWDAINGVAIAPVTTLAVGDQIVAVGAKYVSAGLGSFYGYYVAGPGATYDDFNNGIADLANVDLDAPPDGSPYNGFVGSEAMLFPSGTNAMPFTALTAGTLYFVTQSEPVEGGAADAIVYIARA